MYVQNKSVRLVWDMNCLSSVSCAVPLCVKMSKGIKEPNFQLYEVRSVVLMGYVNGNLFVDNLIKPQKIRTIDN